MNQDLNRILDLRGRSTTLAVWLGWNPAKRSTLVLIADAMPHATRLSRYYLWQQSAPSLSAQISRGRFPLDRFQTESTDERHNDSLGNDNADLSTMMHHAQQAWSRGYGVAQSGVSLFQYTHPSMGGERAPYPPAALTGTETAEERHAQVWHRDWGSMPQQWR